MEHALFWKERKKKMMQGLSIALGAIALFFAAVCTPVYLLLASNVLYQGTVLAFLWDVLMTVTNYLFYWIAFSAVLYAGLRLGFGRIKVLYAVYGAIIGARYFANHLASCILNGVQSINDFVTDYFPYIILDILLDALLMALAVGLTLLCLRHRLPGSGRIEERPAFLSEFLPATRIFDRKNAFLSTMLGVAAIPAAAQLISRLIYDLSLGYIASRLDLLWMFTYYLSDFLFWIAGYMVMLLLMNRFSLSDLKAMQEWNE